MRKDLVREMNEQQDKKAYAEPRLDKRQCLADVTEGGPPVISGAASDTKTVKF